MALREGVVLKGAMALFAMSLLVLLQVKRSIDTQAPRTQLVQQEENWDEGYLHDMIQQNQGQVGDQSKMDRINSLLTKAVTLMNGLKRQDRPQLNEAQQEGAAPEQPKEVVYVEQPKWELNEPSKERLRKYAMMEKQSELPACFKLNKFSDEEVALAKRRLEEATHNLALEYPNWSHDQLIGGKGQDGVWRYDRGPPYVQRLTMFSGPGVNSVGNGNLVRKILGLKLAFGGSCDLRSCQRGMQGNSYIGDFDGAQFRFFYRNACSTLVIPPLSNGAGPVLDDKGVYRLYRYLKEGYNTLVVCGGTSSILFINQNIASVDGGFELEPGWVDGPYEAQSAQRANTPFAALPVSLPGPETSVTGVQLSSLPPNAISYYEAEDVSVVFEIPMGQGRIIYLGYDYSEPIIPWVHTLTAATMFNDWDFKGPAP
ncbi:hypothetical protein GUITHDRAFT_107052 [Guillardia theta CCMP2712]|uniref:Uncharacterized protein n=2 Tax=Guillardia theta TaxID=55529 RepID=L1JF61_GUITC|nr:hypothetical protein GUITHDRAFT_107052 [Guillardia theta CCMP2712]EKX47141.1 hypothetical protein GUITHDRAFT_107052 [Guillardia theta CCMP2712]|mmetsp:Transcript_51181/g.159883  ORF Transcript_51181/g.159883 Transcript_51181/m.159883 type:complete len:427 (+) Transcript_51181:76-1356(+)|eukprot:XP_005834121.1 hypothetical protein GUITHDRAFT_107052 [Guillardia theta CCMP2712]